MFFSFSFCQRTLFWGPTKSEWNQTCKEVLNKSICETFVHLMLDFSASHCIKKVPLIVKTSGLRLLKALWHQWVQTELTWCFTHNPTEGWRNRVYSLQPFLKSWNCLGKSPRMWLDNSVCAMSACDPDSVRKKTQLSVYSWTPTCPCFFIPLETFEALFSGLTLLPLITWSELSHLTLWSSKFGPSEVTASRKCLF